MGFALFTLSVLLTHIFLAVRFISHPEWYQGYEVINILGTLLESAKTYMLISAPFILVFSLALFISNISLIRHERKRLVNLLGIILSFLLVGGEFFIYGMDYSVSGSQTQVLFHSLFINLCAAIYLYFECMLIGTIIAFVALPRIFERLAHAAR